MKPTLLIDQEQFRLIINRLCFELVENHDDFSNTVILGIQPRGIYLAERIKDTLKEIIPNAQIDFGVLDTTFFRDDFRRREQPIAANATSVPFIIENKKVILIDDVLYTGRTIRAAMDAMLAYGRPSFVELLTLVDRRFSRELPIEASYIGKAIDSIDSQRVTVEWAHLNKAKKDRVVLHTSAHNE